MTNIVKAFIGVSRGASGADGLQGENSEFLGELTLGASLYA